MFFFSILLVFIICRATSTILLTFNINTLNLLKNINLIFSQIKYTFKINSTPTLRKVAFQISFQGLEMLTKSFTSFQRFTPKINPTVPSWDLFTLADKQIFRPFSNIFYTVYCLLIMRFNLYTWSTFSLIRSLTLFFFFFSCICGVQRVYTNCTNECHHVHDFTTASQ